jgi:hypothetical protein
MPPNATIIALETALLDCVVTLFAAYRRTQHLRKTWKFETYICQNSLNASGGACGDQEKPFEEMVSVEELGRYKQYKPKYLRELFRTKAVMNKPIVDMIVCISRNGARKRVLSDSHAIVKAKKSYGNEF